MTSCLVFCFVLLFLPLQLLKAEMNPVIVNAPLYLKIKAKKRTVLVKTLIFRQELFDTTGKKP